MHKGTLFCGYVSSSDLWAVSGHSSGSGAQVDWGWAGLGTRPVRRRSKQAGEREGWEWRSRKRNFENAGVPGCKGWGRQGAQSRGVRTSLGQGGAWLWMSPLPPVASCPATELKNEARSLPTHHSWKPPTHRVPSRPYTTCLFPRLLCKVLDFLLETWTVHCFMNLLNS